MLVVPASIATPFPADNAYPLAFEPGFGLTTTTVVVGANMPIILTDREAEFMEVPSSQHTIRAKQGKS